MALFWGASVLCGGKARYTQYPTVFFPQTAQAFEEQLAAFLEAPVTPVPQEFKHNARRFLYFQLYRTSLPMDAFIQTVHRPGFVLLRDFNWEQLLPANSPALQVLHNGILEHQPFLIEG